MSVFNVTCTLLQVDVVCTSRMPQFFLITVMNSGGNVLNETRHQPGQALADFTISLPQSVDVCTLHVRISAGNAVGMSAPSEAVEVGRFQFVNPEGSLKCPTIL